MEAILSLLNLNLLSFLPDPNSFISKKRDHEAKLDMDFYYHGEKTKFVVTVGGNWVQSLEILYLTLLGLLIDGPHAKFYRENDEQEDMEDQSLFL